MIEFNGRWEFISVHCSDARQTESKWRGNPSDTSLSKVINQLAAFTSIKMGKLSYGKVGWQVEGKSLIHQSAQSAQKI